MALSYALQLMSAVTRSLPNQEALHFSALNKSVCVGGWGVGGWGEQEVWEAERMRHKR